MEQFCLPIKDVEDICFKFGLPYEKSTVLKTDLVTYEQIQQELKYIYRRISEDYCSFQGYGAIVIVEHDTEVVTGFKILNQEMELVKKIRKIKFNNNSQDLENKNNTIKEEDENENENYNNNLKSKRTRLDETLINTDKINILMHEISLHQLPRCTHIYCKLFNDIIEDDSINKCLDILEDISKNVYKLGLCNCIKEKNTINSTSINLLSCLIPIDKLDNYNIERMGGHFNIANNFQNNLDTNDISNAIKSKTFLIVEKPIIFH